MIHHQLDPGFESASVAEMLTEESPKEGNRSLGAFRTRGEAHRMGGKGLGPGYRISPRPGTTVLISSDKWMSSVPVQLTGGGENDHNSNQKTEGKRRLAVDIITADRPNKRTVSVRGTTKKGWGVEAEIGGGAEAK